MPDDILAVFAHHGGTTRRLVCRGYAVDRLERLADCLRDTRIGGTILAARSADEALLRTNIDGNLIGRAIRGLGDDAAAVVVAAITNQRRESTSNANQ